MHRVLRPIQSTGNAQTFCVGSLQRFSPTLFESTAYTYYSYYLI